MIKKILLLAFIASLIGCSSKTEYETCVEKVAAGEKKGTKAEKEARAARWCAIQMKDGD